MKAIYFSYMKISYNDSKIELSYVKISFPKTFIRNWVMEKEGLLKYELLIVGMLCFGYWNSYARIMLDQCRMLQHAPYLYAWINTPEPLHLFSDWVPLLIDQGCLLTCKRISSCTCSLQVRPSNWYCCSIYSWLLTFVYNFQTTTLMVGVSAIQAMSSGGGDAHILFLKKFTINVFLMFNITHL